MKKLLIVDDDAPTRRILYATFQHDYDILEAADGMSALKIVQEQKQKPDMVILDGKMPRLDGLAVLAAIKCEPETAHILVVMMTDRGQFSDLETGMGLGADAYFIKPINSKNLRNWVLENMDLAGKVKPLVAETVSES